MAEKDDGGKEADSMTCVCVCVCVCVCLCVLGALEQTAERATKAHPKWACQLV